MDAAARLREMLLQNLRSRVWQPGHRLPTERALGAQFGLGRSTVRRVLGELKAGRLITQMVGSGTYVSAHAERLLGAAPAAIGMPAVSPAELMSARLALEPAIVELVVGNATADDFARMDDCMAHAQGAPTLAEFERWDAALHEAVVAAAHNGLLADVFRHLNDARTQAEWGVLKQRSATPERRREYHEEHRAWIEALKRRDAAQARALCVAHLLHVRANLLGA